MDTHAQGVCELGVERTEWLLLPAEAASSSHLELLLLFGGDRLPPGAIGVLTGGRHQAAEVSEDRPGRGL